MNYIINLLLYYIIFWILITVFGKIIIRILIRNKKDDKFTFIDSLIFSHLIGLSFYIAIVYIFLTFWSFNRFTSYYFFIIVDLVGIIYFGFKKYVKFNPKDLTGFKKKSFIPKNLVIKLQVYLKQNKRWFIFYGFLFFYILFFFIYKFWPIISSETSHFSWDPYLWEGFVYYLSRFGELPYETGLYSYPAGYVIYCAAPISSSFNLIEIHFLTKLMPTFLLFENIFLFTLISHKILNKNCFLIFFSSTLFFIFSYFMYRSLLFVPSPLITKLVIIQIYCLFSEKSKKYYIGITIATIFFIHHLYAIFYTIIFVLYVIIKELLNILKMKTSESNESMNLFSKIYIKFKIFIKSIIKNNFYSILFIITFFLIYAINLTLNYHHDWVKEFIESKISFMDAIMFIYYIFDTIMVTINIDPFYNLFSGFPLISELDQKYFNFKITSFIQQTVYYYFFVFVLVCLIWPIHKYCKEKYRNLVIYSKISVIFCFLVYIIEFKTNFLIIITPSIMEFASLRMAEIVVPYMIFLISFGLLLLSVKISLTTRYLIDKILSKINKRKNTHLVGLIEKNKKKINRALKSIVLVFIIIYSLNLQYASQIPARYNMNSSFDEFMIEFREYEDIYYEHSNDTQSIHYSHEDRRTNTIMKNFFQYDHLLFKSLTLDDLITYTNYIDNNVSLGEIVVLTEYHSLFIPLASGVKYYGEIIFQNSKIIAFEKLSNITILQEIKGFSSSKIGNNPRYWIYNEEDLPQGWGVLASKDQFFNVAQLLAKPDQNASVYLPIPEIEKIYFQTMINFEYNNKNLQISIENSSNDYLAVIDFSSESTIKYLKANGTWNNTFEYYDTNIWYNLTIEWKSGEYFRMKLNSTIIIDDNAKFGKANKIKLIISNSNEIWLADYIYLGYSS